MEDKIIENKYYSFVSSISEFMYLLISLVNP